ncbi:hypothetical protein HMPREF1991_02851 [Hoylesella loescheii DSM 19665 = JCM 12249 = ATCC 15930]|uniref:Uncharacterized protein n=1 Tax=Hoylesella loescheii DSM 19665 = JCM 12249 = ATCC 15930 TaxID=1122985 RepID=A0A069QGM9_HOYLO|nr:hypothetical protein HMPREF1991_02851 [Hoylesella loescheii DSM 19665 = JCM 12249 = ATCC 15930]
MPSSFSLYTTHHFQTPTPINLLLLFIHSTFLNSHTTLVIPSQCNMVSE